MQTKTRMNMKPLLLLSGAILVAAAMTASAADAKTNYEKH
jgi:hypothetical protein